MSVSVCVCVCVCVCMKEREREIVWLQPCHCGTVPHLLETSSSALLNSDVRSFLIFSKHGKLSEIATSCVPHLKGRGQTVQLEVYAPIVPGNGRQLG